jgi:hypothetical protein
MYNGDNNRGCDLLVMRRKQIMKEMTKGDNARSSIRFVVKGVIIDMTFSEACDLVEALEYQVGVQCPDYHGDAGRVVDWDNVHRHREPFVSRYSIERMDANGEHWVRYDHGWVKPDHEGTK